MECNTAAGVWSCVVYWGLRIQASAVLEHLASNCLHHCTWLLAGHGVWMKGLWDGILFLGFRASVLSALKAEDWVDRYAPFTEELLVGQQICALAVSTDLSFLACFAWKGLGVVFTPRNPSHNPTLGDQYTAPLPSSFCLCALIAACCR